MIFESILFKRGEDIQKITSKMPDFFVDTNLNQVMDAVTAGKESYNLKPFFYTTVQDAETVIYRQQVMRDLERDVLFGVIKVFGRKMTDVRKLLPSKEDNYFHYEKERFFLDAAQTYCEAVVSLLQNLEDANPESAGLSAFCEYLSDYIHSSAFIRLSEEAQNLLSELASVKYGVHTKELHVVVLPGQPDVDYSREVEQTFEKFRKEVVKDYNMKIPKEPRMNQVEAFILKGVAQLYPDIFLRLEMFYREHSDFMDPTVWNFDREIQFYIAWLEYISSIRKSGLLFCYPEISGDDKNIFSHETFDVALAHKLIGEKKQVVCNDFYLEGRERIIIVSGPNQGGKTTFARTFGQLHYLASVGCTVPGKDAKLFLFDHLFAHFEEEEDIDNLRSKLEEDLFRIHHILTESTPRSIIIMNEILSSTTYQDAVFLSKKIMGVINSLDVLCVWVTFIDELISISDKTVSMVSEVVPDNPAERTFRVVRKPADGLAYAISIAKKYHVTYSSLINRI